MRITIATLLLAFLATSSSWLWAQDSKKPAPSSAKTETKTAAGSSTAHPETDVLKKWVGDWDATIESTGRDGKPATSAAKSSVKLLGGRWLITDFDGTFMGAPFIGHEVLGYDPSAKKYVLSWVDALATSFATGEGLYNRETKTLTLTLTGRDDSTGKTATWRQVDIWKDADHHDWTLRTLSAKDAKEQIQMTIHYSRHK
jgi:hypothetical protein